MKNTCYFCAKQLNSRTQVYLLDKNKTHVGDYCSKECAVNDAWGPIFSKYYIRKKYVGGK